MPEPLKPEETLEEWQRRYGICPFTPIEMDRIRTELAAEHPHLSFRVEWREGGLFIEAEQVAA